MREFAGAVILFYARRRRRLKRRELKNFVAQVMDFGACATIALETQTADTFSPSTRVTYLALLRSVRRVCASVVSVDDNQLECRSSSSLQRRRFEERRPS